MSRDLLALLGLVSSIAFSGATPSGAAPQDVVARGLAVDRVVDRGVAVEFSPAPTQPRDGEPLTFAFSVRDETTGAPVVGVRPVAWLTRRDSGPAASGANCVRKAATFLGGSLTQRPALDLNEYYVLALNDDSSISVVDPRFGFGGSQLLALIDLDSRGEDWALSPDGATLFVSMPQAGAVAVVETVTWKVRRRLSAGAHPRRMALQPDGARLWVLTDEGVTAFDARSLDRVATIPAPGATALAFTADSRFAMASAPSALLIADTRGGTPPTRVVLDLDPRTLAFSSAAQLAYAGDPMTGAIAAVDARTGRIAARLVAAPGFTQLRFSPDGRYGFLPNPERHIVQIFDAATNHIIRTADVSDGPDQVTFSDRLAYFRRRGSDTILMLSLEQLKTGGEETGVALADFTGGEHAMGRGRWSSLADSIVNAPDGPAVLVANPADRAIYYYKEGMAAPMGGFNNYSREPRAVLVVDRSLREQSSGVYATAKTVAEPGRYDVVFFLDAPRVVSCFALDVAARPETLASRRPTARVEPLDVPRGAIAGAPARLRFRLSDAATQQPVSAEDVEVVAMQAPGIWQQRGPARGVGGGVYAAEFTPPGQGVYYIWVTSGTAGLPLNNQQFLVLTVEEKIE